MGCGDGGALPRNTAEFSLLGHRVSAPGLWAGVGVTLKPAKLEGAQWSWLGQKWFSIWVLGITPGTQG